MLKGVKKMPRHPTRIPEHLQEGYSYAIRHLHAAEREYTKQMGASVEPNNREIYRDLADAYRKSAERLERFL